MSDDDKSDYGHILDVFVSLYKKGLFRSDHKPDDYIINGFDLDIIDFFGVKMAWSGRPNDHQFLIDFIIKCRDRGVPIDWVKSPHAETIYRAMLIKRGVINAEEP